MRVVLKDKRNDIIVCVDDAKSIERNDEKDRFEIEYNNCAYPALRDYERYDLIETIEGFNE